MSDPNHIDDFKAHFRLSRDLYIVIINEVFVVLQRNGHGPQLTVLLDKQLLVALWYLKIQHLLERLHISLVYQLQRYTG